MIYIYNDNTVNNDNDYHNNDNRNSHNNKVIMIYIYTYTQYMNMWYYIYIYMLICFYMSFQNIDRYTSSAFVLYISLLGVTVRQWSANHSFSADGFSCWAALLTKLLGQRENHRTCMKVHVLHCPWMPMWSNRRKTETIWATVLPNRR